MIKFILFDVDGTLIDSQNLIMKSVTAACNAVGIAAPTSRAQLLSGVGLPLREALAHIVPNLIDQQLDDLTRAYRVEQDKILAKGIELEPLFEGITALLDDLLARSYVLGIVTSKSRKVLDGALGRNRIDKFFKTIKTPENGAGKPNPDLLLQAMQENGFSNHQTIYVGDTTFDMIAARRAGVAALGVTWGYHSADELTNAGAHVIIDKITDVIPTIQSWKH